VIEEILMAIVIKNGILIDGTGRPPTDDAIVVIEENKIIYAGKEKDFSQPFPSDAEIIDAHGKTLLPGLIDAHVHYGGSGGVQASEEHTPQEVTKRLYGFLINGVTTIRSCMDALNWAKQLREMERNGKVLMSHLFISGPCFTAPKGHGTEYAQNPKLLQQMARTPTNEDDAREMVRELVKEDVDFIKIIIEGRPPFEKLKAELACVIVDEAHKNGLKASVHTHEYGDAFHMVRCEADSLEHGAAGIKAPDDEIIKLMKKNGTYYVPTLVVHENLSMDSKKIETFLDNHQLRRSVSSVIIQNIRNAISQKMKSRSEAMPKKQDLELMRNRMRSLFRDLIKSLDWIRNAGIPIVAGSDMGNFLTFPGISLHRELELLVNAGLFPMDAIKAATRNAAKLLGTEHKLGTVEKGKLADIIIINGNPLSNISEIRKIETVIKDGQILDLNELTEKINIG